MIHHIAEKIYPIFLKKKLIDDSKREVYFYGLELLLHTTFSTLALLLISILFQKPLEGCIIIAVYYINQTVGGGFHASTHMRCFLLMSIGLILSLLILRSMPSQIIANLLATFSSFLLFAFPLKLHPNKAYLSSKTSYFQKRSRFVVCILFLAFLSSRFWCIPEIQYSYAVGLLVAAVSRISAFLFQDKMA